MRNPPRESRPERLRIPLTVLEQRWEKSDRQIEETIAKGARAGIPLLCAPGCAACCTYVVETLAVECEALAEAVESMPEPVRTETIARLYAWSDAWDAFTPGRPFPNDKRLTARWQARRIACPLLDLDTNLCRAYDARPIACRTHHATIARFIGQRDECGCPHVETAAGCMPTERDAACGHSPSAWQLGVGNEEDHLSLMVYHEASLIRELLGGKPGVPLRVDPATLSRRELDAIEPAVLPVGVLDAGGRRFGWPRPAVLPPLPVVADPSSSEVTWQSADA